MIALRHQIAVLKRSGTRRPCFSLWDRLFWILLSWRWPRWPESLMIIQPETVKRWLRNGWSGLWRYRSGGRWRGGRPRASHEVRELINRMARENFLWGAPRIHGELLLLGFKVSQATVSRYLATVHRSPGQSWRTFIRNQALAFRYRDDLEHSNQDWQSRRDCSYRGNLTRSARQIARRDTGRRWLSQPRRIAAPPRLCARSASLRTFRYSTAPGRSTTGANPVSVSVRMRGPPRHTTRFLKAGGSRKVCRPSFEKGHPLSGADFASHAEIARVWRRCARCAYPKPKPGRIDGGARRGLVSLRCSRTSAPAENPERLYPMRDESGPHCNTKRTP